MKNSRQEKALRDAATHYCGGCGHGIAHRLVCEVIDELGIREKTIAVAPVGCAVIAYDYWNFDVTEAPHGRALAVATGLKRIHPDKCVFTYQGDGDLAAIGLTETVHCANRGEDITCIFINNACYGMTGGQMAPTTLIGQKTVTTPHGRSPQQKEGYPMKVTELLSQLPGVCYAERSSLHSPANIRRAKKAIATAFTAQLQGKGFSIVELLSMCPTVWRMSPPEATVYIEKEMMKTFPLGIIKDTTKGMANDK